MTINDLRFDWAFLQWVVMAVVGVYTWLIGRQSASQRELLELRTRLTALESHIASMPTQTQITELISKLSHSEAQLSGMTEQFSAITRRLETINNFLLQNK
ncbi:TPA: DUF2730 family protein [Klebsiella oxytoca]|uniref:DUF2730 family protein n=1 Tax=Klebsiella oxytoca TaxID=571 RepID=A0AAN5LB33_KLEOX|nr:DUF2730 family protein [Klebsiella oxytoca]